MALNLNLDIEARMQQVYKTLGEPKTAEERKSLTPDEFWQTMRMVAVNNQAIIKCNTK